MAMSTDGIDLAKIIEDRNSVFSVTAEDLIRQQAGGILDSNMQVDQNILGIN